MVAVLLLNASYEPLAVIPWKRAISLLVRNRVDSVTDETAIIHSPGSTWSVPVVLRLRRYINVPKRGAGWSRQGVMRRDNYRCIYCGLAAGDVQHGRPLTRSDFTVDHIIPRSRGGKNSWGNTACACPSCNQRKGNRSPHEAGLTMLWEPKTPRVDYLVASGQIPEAWKIYLEV